MGYNTSQVLPDLLSTRHIHAIKASVYKEVGYPTARVTLARWLKIARVYKQKFTAGSVPGTTYTGYTSVNLEIKNTVPLKLYFYSQAQ